MKKIPLTKGKFAIVDDEDYELLINLKWCAVTLPYNSYAYTGGKIKTSMHRMIMGLKRGDGLVIDHIDNDGLNNQRRNLQIVTASDNAKFMYNRGRHSSSKKY